ncbi:hypothetical protein MRX96_023940 [Rhipicephalus microplus]
MSRGFHTACQRVHQDPLDTNNRTPLKEAAVQDSALIGNYSPILWCATTTSSVKELDACKLTFQVKPRRRFFTPLNWSIIDVNSSNRTGRSKGSRRCSENKSGAEKKKQNTKPRLEEGIHHGVDFGVERSQRISLRRSPAARKSATSFPPRSSGEDGEEREQPLRALVSSTETTVERQRRARAVIDTQTAYPASSSSAHFLSTERSARPVTIRFAPPRATTHTRVVVESGVPYNSSLRAARNICRAGKEKLYSPLAGFQGGGTSNDGDAATSSSGGNT